MLLHKFDDYYFSYTDKNGKQHPGYTDMMAELSEKFPLSQPQIVGEKNRGTLSACLARSFGCGIFWHPLTSSKSGN